MGNHYNTSLGIVPIQKKHILNTCDKKSIEMANVHQNLGFFLETIKVKLYIVFW